MAAKKKKGLDTIGFIETLKGKDLDIQNLDEVLARFKEDAEKQEASAQAIARARGEIAERLIIWYLYTAARKKLDPLAFNQLLWVKLPSSKDEGASKFLSLLQVPEESEITSLLFKDNILKRIKFPSPDLVLIRKPSTPSAEQPSLFTNHQDENGDSAGESPNAVIDKLMKNRESLKVAATEIIAVFSIKTSYRPDRRYQLLYEASMLQALALLLRNANPVPYFSIITTDETDDDEEEKNETDSDLSRFIGPHHLACLACWIHNQNKSKEFLENYINGLKLIEGTFSITSMANAETFIENYIKGLI
ncbi:MAG: Cfr10I/Bse634I family restriction endonuclease [Candidatus Hadarchaeum sp.]|uniref:Cfr10I/Bse634I family restriction endonuclease n=1 Tax=Candidatus Hadarchaeum sp. TaxID=2883567 RepID=UPI003D0BF086